VSATTQQPRRSERRASAIEEQRTDRRQRQRRARESRSREGRPDGLRVAAFAFVVVIVLAAGAYLAFGDLVGQRGAASTADAIPVRLSMAGFTPGEVRVPAGAVVELELWTTDTAPHLDGGVHTMISDELGIHEELPAAGITGESRKVVRITTPPTPGVYDIYCDTCCGGKKSPSMHGKLVVEA
jgi:cytochrome c oxidase subunit II